MFKDLGHSKSDELLTYLSVKLSIYVTFLFTIIAVGAGILGNNQPAHAVLRGFTEGCEGQPQPCWNGIVPGVTDIRLARERIEAKGYTLFSAANDNLYFTNRTNGVTPSSTCSNVRLSLDADNLPITSMIFTGCQDLLVGDTSILGLPEKILGTYIKIGDYFSTEIVEYEYIDDVFQFREWSPFSKDASLYIGTSTYGIHKTVASRGYMWHGFVPRWRYCQLEPAFTDCPK